jgi:hypothetical protein
MRGERRKNFRVEWNSPATIHDVDRELLRPCILANFSNTGARITGVRATTIPDEFVLCITLGRTRKCRVIWRSDDALGVEFTDCVEMAEDVCPEHEVPEPV